MVVVVVIVIVAVRGFSGGIRRRWAGRSRRTRACIDSRLPCPALVTLGRGGVRGRRVLRNAAALRVFPIMTGRGALFTLRRARRVGRSSVGQAARLVLPPEFLTFATVTPRTNGSRDSKRDQGGQNGQNNFELHIYKVTSSRGCGWKRMTKRMKGTVSWP